MKKTLIAMGVLGAFSSLAFAASNVTLYGVIEEGVMVSKAKHKDTTVQMKSGFDKEYTLVCARSRINISCSAFIVDSFEN